MNKYEQYQKEMLNFLLVLFFTYCFSIINVYVYKSINEVLAWLNMALTYNVKIKKEKPLP